MYWKKELKKGQMFLAKHNLKKALKCFEAAVTDCPVSSRIGLDKSLFYLGVTLNKLGRKESAMHCWHVAQKLKKDGLSNEMIKSHSNCYGMTDVECTEEADKAAFIGIQLEKYLKMKKVKRFCSEAEKDVIKDIINSYWLEFLSKGEINHLNVDNKLKFFRQQLIIFPFADVSYFENESHVIFTDFTSGNKISMEDKCSCGSGIVFSQCCGRIKSAEEIEFGAF